MNNFNRFMLSTFIPTIGVLIILIIQKHEFINQLSIIFSLFWFIEAILYIFILGGYKELK